MKKADCETGVVHSVVTSWPRQHRPLREITALSGFGGTQDGVVESAYLLHLNSQHGLVYKAGPVVELLCWHTTPIHSKNIFQKCVFLWLKKKKKLWNLFLAQRNSYTRLPQGLSTQCTLADQRYSLSNNGDVPCKFNSCSLFALAYSCVYIALLMCCV